MSGGSENRRAQRRRHDSVFEIFDDSGNLMMGIGRLVNISSSGVCFSTTREFENGTKLRGRLRLLKEGALLVTGHVVWVRQKANTYLYGVKLDALEPERSR